MLNRGAECSLCLCQYFCFTMFLIRGMRRTRDARVHAPGSPKHRPKKAAADAEEFIAPPFMIAGRNMQISVLAVSSAMPAPKTNPERHTP